MRTIGFAEELDCETIQVSIAHPYPGTAFDSYVRRHGYLTDDDMADELGHQLPNLQYPGLTGRRSSRRSNTSMAGIIFALESSSESCDGRYGTTTNAPVCSVRPKNIYNCAPRGNGSPGPKRQQPNRQLHCASVPDSMHQAQVIINGMIFGKSQEVNDAIIHAFKAGTLTVAA